MTESELGGVADMDASPQVLWRSALKAMLADSEDWLMERILGYAIKQGYSAYTSTLKEAWRLSITGLSVSIHEALTRYSDMPEMTPEEDFAKDPVALFGIVEAQRHRERGVSLSMFLALMKYYRQSFIDMVKIKGADFDIGVASQACEACALFIDRVFDRIEIGFCMEWAGASSDQALQELQSSNRLMTNEKNKYLTIFESIPNPVIILNRAQKVDNMNLSATRLFNRKLAPGSQYYCPGRDRQLEAELADTQVREQIAPACFSGFDAAEVMPWLCEELTDFQQKKLEDMEFEKEIDLDGCPSYFLTRFAKSLDVSGKFDGTIVIMKDITILKNAMREVKTLRGLLPICANCKKIRDDKGFWQQIESYVRDHSDAEFSHGICPDCAKKLYPEFDLYGPPEQS